LAWISASFKANSDGLNLNHRCRDGALPRRFLVFDLDGAAPDAFAELCMLLGAYSGFGYTTASHTAENPHARYMLELSRPGIRLGAAMQWQIETRLGLGALKFDDSVYRGEQPIYGPLVNADVMYYGGNPIDVDAVLATAPEEPLRERPAPPDPYRARLFRLGMVLPRARAGQGRDHVPVCRGPQPGRWGLGPHRIGHLDCVLLAALRRMQVGADPLLARALQ
jgi:hypothetical protein